MNEQIKRVGPEDESRESQIEKPPGSTASGDLKPKDERGRVEPKGDGNPHVTGDVRQG
ncbi:hypothetical protein [Aureimonas sp. AU20]|uniref:hypothetical protein n=1 Tax=Aureimonas sp. AU20 TaxID=1349819 RepID=UPI0007221329|nr:hypothetical protein [Aureimonas sp. AU20]ALN74203.1 hypothetical protein M673_15855 [Aureimonas sp. AU20]